LQGLKPDAVLMGFIGPAKAVPLLQSLPESVFFSQPVTPGVASIGIVPGVNPPACRANEFFRKLWSHALSKHKGPT
jgi:hypothetical protein